MNHSQSFDLLKAIAAEMVPGAYVGQETHHDLFNVTVTIDPRSIMGAAGHESAILAIQEHLIPTARVLEALNVKPERIPSVEGAAAIANCKSEMDRMIAERERLSDELRRERFRKIARKRLFWNRVRVVMWRLYRCAF